MSFIRTESLILQDLLANGEAHGTLIVQRLKKKTAGGVRVTSANVYPYLHKLHEKKLIVFTKGRFSRRGRPRLISTLTPKGRRQAQKERRVLASLIQ